MGQRYAISKEWQTINVGRVCLIEIADLTDTRDGRIYHAGAHRVRITTPVAGFRTKTFTGETAWCSAERYADDVESAAHFADRSER